MVQAVGALTLFAVEVYVQVVVHILVVAVAQLIAHALAAPFYHMHQVLLPEECQRAEDVRLVDGLYLRLQLGECRRAQAPCQLPHHHDAVGRRLNAVRLQQLCTVCFVHTDAKLQIICEIIIAKRDYFIIPLAQPSRHGQDFDSQ